MTDATCNRGLALAYRLEQEQTGQFRHGFEEVLSAHYNDDYDFELSTLSRNACRRPGAFRPSTWLIGLSSGSPPFRSVTVS